MAIITKTLVGIIFILILTFSLVFAQNRNEPELIKEMPASINNVWEDKEFAQIISPWHFGQATQTLTLNPDAPKFVVDDKIKKNLIYALATSPEWCVYYEKGSLVATRRVFGDGRWSLTDSGFYSTYFHGKSYQLQMEIYFDGIPKIYTASKNYGTPLTFNADDFNKKDAFLKIRKTDSWNNEYYESSGWLLFNGLALFVKEASPLASSDVVPNAFTYLVNKVITLSKGKALSKGTDVIPPKIYPELTMEDGRQIGQYNFFATINPQQEGIAYLKIVDQRTGASVVDLFMDSNQIVGWSSNPDEGFLYNRSLVITSVEDNFRNNKEYNILLVFRPKDGGPERVLKSTKGRISEFER